MKTKIAYAAALLMPAHTSFGGTQTAYQDAAQHAYIDQFTGPLPPLLRSIPDDDTACKKLDLMFLVDATGSMDTGITLVQGQAEMIAQTISDRVEDVRMAVATVQDSPKAYGLETDQPYALLSHFSYETQQTITALQRIKIGSGGDAPEAYPYALRMASNEHWRSDAKRISILFADDVARDDRELEESTRNANFHLYSVLSTDYMHWEEYKTYWEQYSKGVYPLDTSTDLIEVISDAVDKECQNDRDISLFL